MIKKKFFKLTVICVAAALALAAVSFVSISLMRKDVKQEPADETYGEDVDAYTKDRSVTLLVVGKDSAASLCDVIMLVRIDTLASRATVLQIPRDTYLEYTESSYRKINGAASALGGMQELCTFLSDAMGITIDGYLASDTEVLAEAVDALGGVEIELDTGRQTLDGSQALYFVRYREGYVRGDLGRMDAQKLFLAALARKLRGLDAITLARLAATVLPKLDTSVSLSEALSLLSAMRAISDENISFVTLSGEETVAQKSGASYYTVSASACAELLSKYFEADGSAFDRKGLFKNENYDSFVKVYESYIPYSMHTVSELCGQGIKTEQ